MQKVLVILVTFNRLDKLKKALESYEKQTYPIEKLIVVDNCSTDGTVEYLKNWESKKIGFKRQLLLIKENSGGAGGFGKGMEFALTQINRNKLDVDWILVSDDDAFPKNDALQKMFEFYDSLNDEEQKKISSLSSAVINHGEIHEAHRSRIEKSILRVRFVGVSKKEYEKPFFEMDLFSYVGTMIKVNALNKAGTTKQELFIYGDDNEHSLRLKKYGKLLCIPKSQFIHDTPGVEIRKVGWHNYYNRRNQLYILKKYFSKRYFWVRLIKRYILDVSPISKYTKDERKLFAIAHQDALGERLGEHPVYKPGFHF